MQSQKGMKIAAIILAALVLVGAGVFAYNYFNDKNDKSISESEKEEVKTAVSEFTSNSAAHESIFKDETVYVIQSSTGKAEKIIVDDWIDNVKETGSIADSSSLDNIEVVKGETKLSKKGNDLVWDTDGEDVYYEGTSTKELPVTCSIKYYLDDKAVSFDKLKGKAGELKVVISYTNHQRVTKAVNGKQYSLYVPFTALSGFALDSDNVKNVKVSSGKVINTGSQCLVIGFAMPGLNEDMEMLGAGSALTFPNSVEITADVRDFNLDTIFTVVTADGASGVNLSDSVSFDDLGNKLGELSDGISQLADGSSELYDGMKTLLDKTNELNDGAGQLRDGMYTLNKGVGKINSAAVKFRKGASKLSVGADEIHEGLKELNSNSDLLNDGMETAFKELLKTATEQLQSDEDFEALDLNLKDLTPKNYEEELERVIGLLEEDQGEAYENAKIAAEKEVRAIVEGKEAQDKIREEIGDICESRAKKSVKNTVNAKIYGNTEDGSYEDADGNITQSRYQQVQEIAIEYLQKYTEGQILSIEEYEKYKDMTVDQYEGLADIDLQGYLKATVARNVNGLAVGETADEETILAVTDVLMRAALNLELGIVDRTEYYEEAEAVDLIIEREYKKYLLTDEYKDDLEEKIDKTTETYIRLYMNGQNEDIDEINVPEQINEKLGDGAKQVNSLLTQLRSFETLVDGVKEYTEGVAKLYEGSAELVDGVSELEKGTKELKKGTAQLKTGSQKLKRASDRLYDGTSKMVKGEEELVSGSLKLKDGMAELQEAFGDDLGDAAGALQALIDISNEYNNYSGKKSTMDGSVKFIYRTQAVE